MLINFSVYKSDIKKRLTYLTQRDKDKIDIIGNVSLFEEKIKLNKYKTKSFNILVSFREDKEELEEKLRKHSKTIADLHDEIISLLTAMYSEDELNILTVAHSDTDNYHFHITIDSRNQLTDTQLYFEKSMQFIEYMRTIERYIELKYNLASKEENKSLITKGGVGIEKIKQILDEKGEYKNKTRDEIKEEITNILATLIANNVINSRDELIEYLRQIADVNRIGKDYISLKYQSEKIRLKGGIYSDEEFRRIKKQISDRATTDRTDKQTELEEVSRKLAELQQEIVSRVEKRFRTARERVENKIHEIVNLNRNNINVDSDNSVNNSNINNTDNKQQQQGHNQGAIHRAERLYTDKEQTFLHTARREMATSTDRYMHSEEIAKRYDDMKKKYQEKRKEELEAIKEISPEEIIADLGLQCIKRHNYYECRAIWRGDRNPSLSIFKSPTGKWIWKDHATGETGTWIDLYMTASNMSYVEAVRYLRENFLSADFYTTKRKDNAESKNQFFSSSSQTQSKYKILSVEEKEISKQVIRNFLKEHRKINNIPSWLRQIEYEVADLETGEIFKYFGYGVKDTAGNYHIRYAINKSKTKERVLRLNQDDGSTYSLISKNSNKLVIVEGFIDGIRADELFLNADILILNGVENTKKALDTIAKYDEIIIATDNDVAGVKARVQIIEHLKNKCKQIYKVEFDENIKDLDDAVKNNKEIKIKKITEQRDIKHNQDRDFKTDFKR